MNETSNRAAERTTQPAVTVINVFTPKAERFDAFVEEQHAGLPSFRGKVPGLIASRFYGSVDSRTAVLMSVWETQGDFEAFRKSELFAAHRDRLSPLLERADPGVYHLVYQNGSLGF